MLNSGRWCTFNVHFSLNHFASDAFNCAVNCAVNYFVKCFVKCFVKYFVNHAVIAQRLWVLLMLGVSVQLPAHALPTPEPAPAERIIALAPHLVENLYSIGAGDKIVGTIDYADYPAEALTIPRVGSFHGLNFEQIVALKPDLILAWHSGTAAADIAKLQRLGLPVVVSQVDTLADVATHLRQLGELTGLHASANQQAQRYLQQLTALQQQYQNAAAIAAFYELWGTPLTTVAQQAWPAQQLAICRVDNIFASASAQYPQVNIEQVFSHAPALIIQPTSTSEPRELVNWSQWPGIPAVKMNAIVRPNADALHRSTMRMLDELTKLCQQIEKIRARSSSRAAQ